MPSRPLQWAVLVVIVLLAIAFVGRRIASVDPVPVPAATAIEAGSPTPPAAHSSPAAPKAAAANPAASPKPTSGAKPTGAGAVSKPADAPAVDRERLVRDATWAPGQLASHFEKHGREGPWASESVYDASARETITQGTAFTYLDRESNAERIGFYDKAGNRFTAVSRDGRRITTHFRPDRGEVYVRSLSRSTYR